MSKSKKLVAKHTDRIVLAEGEVTGHAHRFSGGGALLEEYDDGSKVLESGGGGKLTHEEHNTLEIAPGTRFDVFVDQEMDHAEEAARDVAD